MRAPEFRGNIRRRLGNAPIWSARLLLTEKVFFLFSLAIAFLALQAAVTPALAKGEPFFSRLEPGACARMFALPDLDGEKRALAEESGRPVLVHFFATWCEPCKDELPGLQQFVDARRGEIGILAVNVGEVPSRVRNFLKQTPVTFPVVLDADRSVTRSWAIEGLPATVVLDRTLTPRLAVTGDLDWTDARVGREIETVLANKSESQQADCPREIVQ